MPPCLRTYAILRLGYQEPHLPECRFVGLFADRQTQLCPIAKLALVWGIIHTMEKAKPLALDGPITITITSTSGLRLCR